MTDTKVVKSTINQAAISRIETDVVDMELYQFGEAISTLSTATLEEMVRHIDGCLWDNITHEGIRRMRLIMTLKAGYYPDLVPMHSPHTPSAWADIPTEKLIETADKMGLHHAEVYHKGIRRMRLIMALKAANVNPESLM